MTRFLGKALMLVGAGWLAWTAYALVAPEAEDELPEKLVATIERADIDFVEMMARQLGAPVTHENDVELLVNGVEIFPPMLEAIGAARESIHLLTYVYWQGGIARDFARALADAVGRGVEVRLLLDAYGAAKMKPTLVDELEAAGVIVAWFHPIDWYNIRRLNQRTHRKVLVVDGEIAFTGGVGIAEEWSGDAGGPNEWRDDHFRVTGPAVRYLDGAFAENWLNATGEVLVGDQERLDAPLPGPAGDVRALVVPTSPRGGMSPVALIYWTALTIATRSVDIATPYFAPDPALLETIMATARRGVRVRLLLPGDNNDQKIVHAVEQTYYSELIESGVEVHLFEPTMMHAKMVVVDERWSIVGSANFDNRSFELNDEIVLVCDSEPLNAALREAFEKDLSRANRLDGYELGIIDRLRGALYHVLLVLREQL